ncbi:MAG: WD40/YVTN/BNR-like repeat-containing protein [Bryobacteraceae bacterium]
MKTGIVNDLVMDPSNPATLYASVQSDGVYKTSTGGATGDSAWTKLPGLPASEFTRISLALCRNVPTTIYAGLSGSPFRVFRSADGATFSLSFTAASSIYNPGMGVDPSNPSIVYVLSAQFLRSTDGGVSFAPPIGDSHECQKFALDPIAPSVIYLGRDNGLFRSPDDGSNWAQIGTGIANVEFYDGALAATDSRLMIGGTQDNGTIKYDSSSTVWNEIQGGDGGTVAIDPTNAQVFYAMDQDINSIIRSANGGAPGSWSPIGAGLPSGTCVTTSSATDFVAPHWQLHPNHPATLLASCQSLWQSVNSGSDWTAIFTPPAGSVRRSAVDPSNGLYYAASDQGRLFVVPDGTEVWAHPSGTPASDLLIDPVNIGIAFVTCGGGGPAGQGRVFRLVRGPSGFAGNDITSNLPTGLEAKTIAVDRIAPLTIYVGTDRGVYRGVSPNQGGTWTWDSYNDGLPLANVTHLEVHPTSGVMRATTFGRSAYEVYTDWPIGTLAQAQGVITFLLVQEVGAGFGPPKDLLDVEVVITLDTLPGRGFGFQLRADSEEETRHGMLGLLRNVFARNGRVTVDYTKTGLRNGSILRVAEIP